MLYLKVKRHQLRLPYINASLEVRGNLLHHTVSLTIFSDGGEKNMSYRVCMLTWPPSCMLFLYMSVLSGPEKKCISAVKAGLRRILLLL